MYIWGVYWYFIEIKGLLRYDLREMVIVLLKQHVLAVPAKVDQRAKDMKGMDPESILKEAFEQYYDYLFKYCLACLNGDEQAAMDAVGNVFIIAKSKSGSLETIKDMKLWLRSLAYNSVRSIRRKNRRYYKRFILFDPGTMEAGDYVDDVKISWWEKNVLSSRTFDEAELDDAKLSDEEIQDLKSAFLNALSDEERILFCSHYEEGASTKELAARYGKSQDAIRMHLLRISIKLVERIKIYFQNERSF